MLKNVRQEKLNPCRDSQIKNGGVKKLDVNE